MYLGYIYAAMILTSKQLTYNWLSVIYKTINTYTFSNIFYKNLIEKLLLELSFQF